MSTRGPLFLFALTTMTLGFVFACGGTVAEPSSSDAGGLPADGGSGSRDATTDAVITIDASDTTCEEILKGIDALRPKVRTCCAACRSLQCMQTVDDLCCPFTATTVDPNFVAMVAEYKKRCGPIDCPAIVCTETPSKVCDPEQGNPSSGTCR
jgi:hypothetical protein